MSILEQFFQATAIIMVMLVASDHAIGFFGPVMAGIPTAQVCSTLVLETSGLSKTTIGQTATLPVVPVIDIFGFSKFANQLSDIGNTQCVLTQVFARINPDISGPEDSAEQMGVFINTILTIFLWCGVAYIPIAIVAVFFGGGKP